MPMMFEEANEAYGIAIARAVDELALADPAEVCASRGVPFDEERGEFVVEMLGRPYRVRFPFGEIVDGRGRPVSGGLAVLLLHYLVFRGEPLRAEGWLAYRDLPGGRDFSRAFEGMAERKLSDRFGEDPVGFAAAAQALGAERGEAGEHSFIFPVFPRLSLLAVLWPGEEGLPGAARILFPPRASCYLHTEDLAALGEALADRLIHIADRGE